MDRFDRFRIFIRVAEAGSFTHAATQLGLPRASVSTAVQELEAGVGVQLLNRTTQKVNLTVEGQAFLGRAMQLLDQLEETEALFRRAAPPSGRLRLTAPSRVGQFVLAPALPGFLAACPEITIELCTSDRFRDLVEDDIDCAVP